MNQLTVFLSGCDRNTRISLLIPLLFHAFFLPLSQFPMPLQRAKGVKRVYGIYRKHQGLLELNLGFGANGCCRHSPRARLQPGWNFTLRPFPRPTPPKNSHRCSDLNNSPLVRWFCRVSKKAGRQFGQSLEFLLPPCLVTVQFQTTALGAPYEFSVLPVPKLIFKPWSTCALAVWIAFLRLN